MFTEEVYSERRKQLRAEVGAGVILLLGQREVPINHRGDVYPFRQDSSFLYYFGHNIPDLAGVIDVDKDETIFFGPSPSMDELVWTGPQPELADLATQIGVKNSKPFPELKEYIEQILIEKRQIHILPTYRDDMVANFAGLLGVSHNFVGTYISAVLINAVVKQRSIKSPLEVAEIESALEISSVIYEKVRSMIAPGIYECEILGAVEEIVAKHQSRYAFSPIITVHGEFLHNPFHRNKLEDGQLLLVDTGVESVNHYASDITRTYPVNGKLSEKQKAIYEIVSATQQNAIKAMQPGKKYMDIHLNAAKNIFNGLKELGITKGDVGAAVVEGAHALFFPHGLGHMLGLDAHDMRGLGDHAPGYDSEVKPSERSGLSVLRMGRELQKDFVVTVEPGIYFIPLRIKQWEAEKKFADFINYAALEPYLDFGGIRLENDILITEDGHRVLGRPIPGAN